MSDAEKIQETTTGNPPLWMVFNNVATDDKSCQLWTVTEVKDDGYWSGRFECSWPIAQPDGSTKIDVYQAIVSRKSPGAAWVDISVNGEPYFTASSGFSFPQLKKAIYKMVTSLIVYRYRHVRRNGFRRANQRARKEAQHV